MKERKLYQKKMDAQLKEWAADIDKLRAKAQKADADTRLKLNKQIKNVRARFDDARERFEDMTEAGEDAFESAKSRFESAMADFRKALK